MTARVSLESPVFGLTGNSDVIRITAASRARKEQHAKRLRYYWDNSHDDAYALIARRFAKPESFRIFSINVVRAIADKRASTYRQPPRRTFTGMDQAAGDELYRSLNADAVLKKASRYLEVCKTVMLQIGWDGDTEQPTLSVLTPSTLDVLGANPDRPERVIVTYAGDRPEDVYYGEWTATSFKRLNHRGAKQPIDGNPGNLNPYGQLPFVAWHERLPDDDFFIPGGDDLFAAQDALNVGLSNLWRAVEFQSLGQPFATGISANEILQFGPDRVIALPQGGTFGYASPNAPITSILAALEFILRETAATYGVGSDLFDLSKVAESGSAKHAGRLDLKEVRQDQVAQARAMETRLFSTLKAVVNTHRPGAIPDDATIGCDFAEQHDQLSEAELLENARSKVDLGAWSPVDVLIALNPDGFPDRDTAFRELKRRNDESAALAAPL